MSFEELIVKVKNLPYGRNANRYDFSLVLSENKGTCSSKHAFLKSFGRFGLTKPRSARSVEYPIEEDCAQ